MKQKIKETILGYLVIFAIGGTLGLIYGVLCGNYSYYEELMLVKIVVMTFIAGGMLLMMFLAAVSMVTAGLGIIFKFLKAKLLK